MALSLILDHCQEKIYWYHVSRRISTAVYVSMTTFSMEKYVRSNNICLDHRQQEKPFQASQPPPRRCFLDFTTTTYHSDFSENNASTRQYELSTLIHLGITSRARTKITAPGTKHRFKKADVSDTSTTGGSALRALPFKLPVPVHWL